MLTKQVHLLRRPEKVSVDDFEVREVDLPELENNQVLIENLYMSVDPYMRRSMESDGKDLDPWPLNAPLDGPSIGRVIESNNPNYAIGDIVESMSGWQQHFISDAEDFVPYLSSNNAIVKRNGVENIDPMDYVGLLGIASQTAYFAMMCATTLVPGETTVISSGAGSVGSLACQIAKIQGARVVTSAGSDRKVEWLRDELGVDFAFNYKTTPIDIGLREGCPNGIDQVLENASPEHFSACLPLMNFGKQLLIAGMVGIYDSGGKVNNIDNFEHVLDSFLTIKGHLFMDYLDAYDQFTKDMLTWRGEGKLIQKVHVFEGIESAPEALLALFNGKGRGKIVVRV
ncbi:NADP-dependent oxidoreductase [Pseudomaricurvus alkylphenolicus]|uniref:MDR family NADP-dependent oxidoreductase n=1 Tax=Pseudomaricurvus alkylphenolicus TaxID=1306991 RepID=UPI001422A1F8|nr:NADP-dependent oxidoreductase [Pseudomaricurvus alkylphenolicus]NIB42253.1 NADP-dependent oxidoreductase [Pseudomaricurvus alkylphenolicus]